MRSFIASLLLAGSLASIAFAQHPVPVYCGSFTPFRFRVPLKDKDPETRANQAMDVINKYLGGKVSKVSLKKDGSNMRLLLNNELVAVVTPADAKAEKVKSTTQLATRWQKQLLQAFEASKAQK